VNPIGVRSCYDEGKRCAETLFFDYWRQHKLHIKIVRIFNTYGPNMHPNDGRVVSNFIVQALQNKNITIYGDGSQTRSFQYVDDLIEGMVKMMNSPKSFIGPINMGNLEEFTIKQLAEKILKLIPKSKSKIIYKKLPTDDPKQRKPDISLAKKKLHWEPKIKLDEGLIKTIEYFKNKLNK
jgi:UDP-glucuronate decarboxylase